MIDWLIGTAYAMGPQMGGPGAPANPAQGMMTFLIPVALLVVFYYFIIHLPQSKRRKEREGMLKNMKRGDEVLTAGGIYGKITGVADQSVTIEIAPKVRVKTLKSSITQIVAQAPGEEESKE